ncbi:Wnt-activated receptor [Tyrophagus putrescentiae]|nr:Wnt-activated receptor [Tyrophagus putrescentiae]
MSVLCFSPSCCFSFKRSPPLSSGSICEPITTPHCLAIGYNQTFYSAGHFNNGLGHRSQAEAAAALYDFYGLIELRCSPDLPLLLCSLFTPVCIQTRVEGSLLEIENEVSSLSVCRSVCERARAGCEPLVTGAGFPWPHFLNCSLFPVEFCMENSHHHLLQKLLEEGAEAEAEADVEHHVPDVKDFTPDPQKQLLLRNETFPGANSTTRTAAKQASLFGHLFSAETLSSLITIVTSATAVVLCLFALLTTWLGAWSRQHHQELEYPTAVLPYPTACWLVTSTLQLMGAILGGSSPSLPSPSSFSSPSLCLLSTLLLSYLSTAGDYWSTVWAFAWYLKARRAWAEEAVHRMATWFHLVGWLLPGAQLAASLLLQTTTIFHACYAASSSPSSTKLEVGPSASFYVFALPSAVAYLLAVCLLACSIGGLRAIHRTVRLNRLKEEEEEVENGKEEKEDGGGDYFLKEAEPVRAVLCRLLLTSAGYCLLQCMVLSALFYRQFFDSRSSKNGMIGLAQLVGCSGSALLAIGSSLVLLTSEDTLEVWVQLFKGRGKNSKVEGQPTSITTTTATNDTLYASILGSDEEDNTA